MTFDDNVDQRACGPLLKGLKHRDNRDIASRDSFKIFQIMYQNVSNIPIVPHEAVAKVSKIGHYIGEVSCCDAWMAERIH
jgi:hypothetical protein